MVYTIGHEEDEKLHSENHDIYLQLKFPGWKDERVIGNYDDGRVIKILKEDKHFKLKKVQDILLLINRELGFPSAVYNGYLQGQNIMIIMFISSDKFVKGCLVAESITSASPVVLHETGTSKSYYASSKTVHAICGINRIWVARKCRKQKIASRMVDCLRSNFILGLVVSLEELAFTDPTEDGMQFASSYTGTDNFLVYK
uniref:N-acetyltransferase ESCO1 n=1 Tax=Parasteatoda tepidariorum TaxID=114398 RepID=A0A2L2Y9C6_PARTP